MGHLPSRTDCGLVQGRGLSREQLGPSPPFRRHAAYHAGRMTIGASAVDTLYRPRRDRVEFIDVPELAFLVVPGSGAPEAPAFGDAIRALYAVSYGAHFLLKKRVGEAPRVMPLEALWWVGDDEQQALVAAAMEGDGTMAGTDRDRWHWQAMIRQAAPIDADVVAESIAQARTKGVPALDRMAFPTWEEGPCAQLMHVGPYAAEAPSLRRLHSAIHDAGMRARGRHHEVYLGDPRRSAPERLRTILRQPVEAA
ncbi:GyrI-like domain-containing protein [Pedococcus sp.]|uniref:GyrI-like domain-containing protein n=1 Tax=Pedococcus sp. TaxID=2860345 RepID=UPI002E1328F9|nr:GyrI-like domain-containing protein [Pedococcus sp.]